MRKPKGLSYSPITTREQALKFLKVWPAYIAANQFDAIHDAVIALDDFLDLDVMPFLMACIKCPDGIVQIAAISEMREKIEHSSYPGEVKILLELAQSSEPNFVVRGAALESLGRIAHVLHLPSVLPILLSILRNSSENRSLRLSAYMGLIRLAGKESDDPKYYIWRFKFERPVEEQVDWKWIEELETQNGQRAKKPGKQVGKSNDQQLKLSIESNVQISKRNVAPKRKLSKKTPPRTNKKKSK